MSNLIPILRVGASTESTQPTSPLEGDILLMKPPFFTPWTPPLGISILKSYLREHGYHARCVDFNMDPVLWGTHHAYFNALQSLEDLTINDGYSKLWWIINAHMLAFVNTGSRAACEQVLRAVIELYGIRYDDSVLQSLSAIVERFFARLSEMFGEMDLANVSVVGSSTYSTSLAASLFLLRRIKDRYPNIKTIMGGGIFADDLALGSENLTILLENYPWLDHVVLGEGEEPLLKIVKGELSHKRVISLADAGGNTLGMDSVPVPDFSDFDLSNYFHLTIEGARSCPFQCHFCSETIQWGKYRKKTAEVFAEQVTGLATRFKNNSFFMGDSLMNPYINAFSKQLMKLNADILYDGYMRADVLAASPERVKQWARSGLYRVRLGIESGSARVLQAMDKMNTPEVISAALKSLSSAGVRNTTYWIVGFPGETEEDFEETLEFIARHHRYIYELEAHPYYYYPYGQIGSRLHRCYSLYPEEVTSLIKFKVWEIEDADPTREERYRRLRRIAKLSSDLGLVNIYTMQDRYKAEARWLRLYPLAKEVYEGTLPRRGEVRLPDEPFPAPAGDWSWRDSDGCDPAEIICYEVEARETIDPEMLKKAVAALTEATEILRLTLKDGHYRADPARAAQDASPVELFKGAAGELANTARIVNEVVHGMGPARGRSLRLALLRAEGEQDRLLLIAHRAIADHRSMPLLLQDLYRIYQQLTNGHEISLSPSKASFHQIAAGLNCATPQTSPDDAMPQVGYHSARLDKNARRALDSETLRAIDITAAEFFAGAVLLTLQRVGAAFALDCTFDFRTVYGDAAELPGPLTAIVALHPEADSHPEVETRFTSLRALVAQQARLVARAPATRVLVNCEGLQEGPWFGGEKWVSRGQLLATAVRRGYGVEVAPALLDDGLELRILYAQGESNQKLAQALGSGLQQSTDDLLKECGRYEAAARFWREQLDGCPKQSYLESLLAPASPDAGAQSAAETVGRSEDRIPAGVAPSAALLSAYAVLLSHLGASEDVMFEWRDGEASPIPLRLTVPRSASFAELASAVERTRSRAAEFAAHAPRVLGDHFALEAGCAWGRPTSRWNLALEGADRDGLLEMRLSSATGRIAQPTLSALLSCITSILDAAEHNPAIPINSIKLGRPRTIFAKATAADDFDFS